MKHYITTSNISIEEVFQLRDFGATQTGLIFSRFQFVYFYLTFPDGSKLELKSPLLDGTSDNRMPFYDYYSGTTINLSIDDIVSGLVDYPDSYTLNSTSISFPYTYFPEGVYTVEFKTTVTGTESYQGKRILNLIPIYEGLKYMVDELLESESDATCVLTLPDGFDEDLDRACFVNMIKDLVYYLYDSEQYTEASKHLKTLTNILAEIPYEDIEP